MKQYKPMIRAKGSKYTVEHGGGSGNKAMVYGHQAPPILISKKKSESAVSTSKLIGAA